MDSSFRGVPRRMVGGRPMNRIANLSRFDTVVFIPAFGRLEVWRYKEGSYVGNNQIVFSESGYNWVTDRTQFLQLVKIMGWAADLHVPQWESDLPHGYWGLRFR